MSKSAEAIAKLAGEAINRANRNAFALCTGPQHLAEMSSFLVPVMVREIGLHIVAMCHCMGEGADPQEALEAGQDCDEHDIVYTQYQLEQRQGKERGPCGRVRQ